LTALSAIADGATAINPSHMTHNTNRERLMLKRFPINKPFFANSTKENQTDQDT
jgi:hypothetical protein